MPSDLSWSLAEAGISIVVPSGFANLPSRQKNSRPDSVSDRPSPWYLYHPSTPESTIGRGIPYAWKLPTLSGPTLTSGERGSTTSLANVLDARPIVNPKASMLTMQRRLWAAPLNRRAPFAETGVLIATVHSPLEVGLGRCLFSPPFRKIGYSSNFGCSPTFASRAKWRVAKQVVWEEVLEPAG